MPQRKKERQGIQLACLLAHDTFVGASRHSHTLQATRSLAVLLTVIICDLSG